MGSLSKEERDIIVGCLLGDGTMRCKTHALLEINHSIKQQDYVDWKYSKLQRLVLTPPKSRKGNDKRVAYRFVTRSIPELTPYYGRFYQLGKKIIPADIELDPMSVAIWVMDDGSKSYRAMYLNTQNFTIHDQQILIGRLRGQFKIHSTLNKDKQYTRIRISVESVPRLYDLVAPYILPMFDYKFPL